jgi:hypothetical protein
MFSILSNNFFKHFTSIRNNATYLLVIMLIATANFAYAEEAVPDKFKIALGGYSVFRYDSTISLTEPEIGGGISISPEDTLGLKGTQTVLRLTGHYRFSRKHALIYSWYSISADGNKVVEEEFDWLDENGDTITIPIGAEVDSSLDYDIFKAGYLWSFYHTDKVELAAGAGLHVTRIAIGMHAETTSSGIDTQDVATTVPLPVFSFNLTYNLTPKFSWDLRAEAFALKFEDWDGVYTDISLSMEYRAFKNVGLGIGLNTNSLKVTESTSEHKFAYDNSITGILVYAAAYF